MHDSIAIVGDVHLTPKIASRVDDYFESCLQKIEEISSKCKHVIFLGDLFETPTIPHNYFISLYTRLNKLKCVNGNQFYSIIGNHDIYNEREVSLDRTCLGLCDATQIIKVITPSSSVTICGIDFHTSYVNFEKCKTHLASVKFKQTDILLLHQYFEDLYECLKYEDVRNLGVNKIFFGHEHKPMPNFYTAYPEFTAYRCGSCGRNRADDYNLDRDIYYYVIRNNQVEVNTLQCTRPACEVFTEEAYTRQNLRKKQFLTNVNDVINKYSNNISVQDKFSIRSILKEINTPDRCFEYIRNKYDDINQVFN